MLTARGDDLDVVVGLDAGADDYLSKPFSMSVLLARLRAHLRVRPQVPPRVVQVGALHVDLAARRCTLGGAEVTLRPKEFDLLAVLSLQAGTVVSRHDLMAEVWEGTGTAPPKTLDVTMLALRRALAAADGGPPPTIMTIRGKGYRLETNR